jgi:autotransporter-associated beta strand protein
MMNMRLVNYADSKRVRPDDFLQKFAIPGEFRVFIRSITLFLVIILGGLSALGQTATATTSTVTANPATIPTSGTTRLTIQLRTSDGTKLTTGGATVTFATPSAGTIGSVTDHGDGTYSATYTAGASAGTITITPKLSGTDFSNKVFVVVGSQYVIDGTSGNNAVGHSFSTNGNLSLSQGFFVDYLIVGGGGGGGNTTGGGGGGGGVQWSTSAVSATSYGVTVGSGGAGGWPAGTNGGSSSVLSITAGGGVAGRSDTRVGGNTGAPQSLSGGTGWVRTGGGDGASGGGGAGAGAAGSNGVSLSVGGNGGGGMASTITGTSVTYAGGGGGGCEYNNATANGTGGSGGGGNGGQGYNDSRKNGANATGYGSGGGGGGAYSGPGGSGSAGLVVLRYQGNSLGSIGGTVSSGTISASGNTLHTFTSGGTFNLSSLNLNSRLGSILSGTISGTGDLTYSGPGQLTLTANNTYSGQTIITGGTIQVGLNGTTGNLGGGRFDIRSGAALAFSRSDNVSLTNILYLPGTGTRTLSNLGAGTLTFSGSVNISGESANPATLAISGTGAIVIDQSIASGGEALNLVKSGGGTLILSSSSNGYTGTTVVNGGTLKVSGQSGFGAVTVNSGAILTGSGTVKGATTIQSGGTIITDRVNSVLTIENSLTLAGGSNYNWKVSSASGTAGTDWDHVQVNGALNITATSGSKCNINLWSLLPDGSNGEIANFLPTENSYTWTILTTTGGITGFDANAFNVVITPANGTGGITSSYNVDGFSIIQDGNVLKLQYSPPLTQIIDATDNQNKNTALLNYTTNTSSGTLTVGLGFYVDYLLVGGGGGGGSNSAGGGGAGGFRSGSTSLAASSHVITVGAGGSGGTSSANGSNGGNTTAFGISVGGGFGASRNGGNSGTPQSNAGASGWQSGGGDGAAGGGGAGSGGIGSSGSANSVGGNGGIGSSSSITGSSIIYAAGGGGGNEYTAGGAAAGTGGSSVGGNGGQGFSDSRKNAANGSNYGSGGGGGGGFSGSGGAGSGGVVIARYKGSSLGSVGGTVTSGTGTATGYTLHSFTSSGSLNMSGVNLSGRLRATMSGNIIGSGSIIYAGPGDLTLTGANTYAGTTTVSSGTLEVGDGGTSGNLGTGAITSNATLRFNRSNTYTLGASNIISGTGTVEQSGTGILDLGGITTHQAGTWSLRSGSISNGTIAGGDFSLMNGTVSAVLSGTGNLSKTGTGTVTLSSGNTYSGTTSISAGILEINGMSGTGAVTVASGATLTGTGTVKGATTIQSGGTITPAQSIAQLTVDNGLILDGGAHYNWKVKDVSGTAGVHWDHLQVNGSVTVNATNSNKCNINIWSLLPDGTDGEINQFKPSENTYSWTILTSSGGITGFAADKFNVVIEPSNGTGGLTSRYNADGFTVMQDGNSLKLVYSPPVSQLIDGTNDLSVHSTSLNYTTNTSAGSLTLGLGFFVDHLHVGGGGGGGSNSAGGGGAGGVRSGYRALTGSNHSVTIGGGGAGGSSGGSGSNGGNTVAFGITVGGGQGAGRNGGSSGTPQSKFGGSGWTIAAGDGASGGGGAGAGGSGSTGKTNSVGGNGGAGFSSSITGSAVTYAAGGGGGSEYTAFSTSTGLGASGGGGNGGQGFSDGRKNAATATGYGSGGGGGGAFNGTGGAGSGGIVILRYPGTALNTVGGSVTTGSGTATGHTIHSFTSTGTFNLSGVNMNARLRATLTGNIIGSGNLIYSGPGVLSITSSAHTYSGTTSITAGELRVNGSLTNSTEVSVSSGATLSGTGTLPSTTVSGTHAPGTSPGLQTVSGNLTYAGGSSINMEIASNAIGTRGTDHDAINVTGNLDFSGATTMNLLFNGTGSNVDWTDAFWRNTRSGSNGWKLYEVTGSVSGLSNVTLTLPTAALDKNGITLSSARNGSTVAFSLVQVGNGVYLTYTVTSSTITWTGATSSSWSTTTNWSPNGTPATEQSVVIGTSSNAPAFSGTGTYRQLTVNSGATLMLASSSTMSLYGDLTNNGTVSGDGTLELSGTTAQNLTGTGTLQHLKINNSNGVTIASGSNKQYITGVLTPTSGVLTTNGNLVFRSTATAEGTVGMPGTCPTEPISGDVTVEKYLPAKRAFRLLTPGVTTSTTIQSNWQEGGVINSTTGYPFTSAGAQNPSPGYGTHITGSGGSSNGFDATVTNNPSLFTYDALAAAWVAEGNTNSAGNVLRSGEGYRLLVRGSRAADLNNNAATADATTLRTTGTLEVCATRTFTTSSTVPLSNASAGFALVGNPYWSVVDWHAVTKTNLEPTLYYWDPTLTGTGNRGAYVSYNITTGSSNVSSAVNRYIQPGQAFFVRNTTGVDGSSTLPTLSITKDHLVTGTGNRTTIFGRAPRLEVGGERVSTSLEKIYVSLLPKGRAVQGVADGVLIAYGRTFGMERGSEDAVKLPNPDENLSADYGGRSHSILGLPSSADVPDTIPLGLWNLTPGRYSLKFNLRSLTAGREIWVYDRTLRRITAVQGDGYEYDLDIPAGVVRRDGLMLIVHGRASLESAGSGLVIFPNPLVTERLQVLVPLSAGGWQPEGAEATLELTGLQGAVLQRLPLLLDGRGRGIVELPGVRSGTYVVRVRLSDGRVFTTKLIKP